MHTLSLKAERRDDIGKRAKNLRRQGRIPAVLYGREMTTLPIVVEEIPLQKVWHVAGESSLVDVHVGDAKPVKALIQDMQTDPATGRILHVDFHQVNMKEKIEVEVTLRFDGEPPAVKELGGTLIKGHDAVKVECLPGDLVREIVVDVTGLKTFDDVIRMKDVPLPDGFTLLSSPDDLIVNVEPPRTEAELAELDTKVEEDVTKVEKIEKPKEEEEAAAEGTPEAGTPPEKT